MSILPMALKEQRRLGKRICIIIIISVAFCFINLTHFENYGYGSTLLFVGSSLFMTFCFYLNGILTPASACNNNSLLSIPKSLPSAHLGFTGYRLGIFKTVWLKIWRRYG